MSAWNRLGLGLLMGSLWGCAGTAGEGVKPLPPADPPKAARYFSDSLAEMSKLDRENGWTDAKCSELATAFEIGFLIFLPFLVIDLVISNILMAMGMQMLTPTTVSLPFKLLLFVLVDGWVKLAHGLVLAYL